jgi:hypothetical protein
LADFPSLGNEGGEGVLVVVVVEVAAVLAEGFVEDVAAEVFGVGDAAVVGVSEWEGAVEDAVGDVRIVGVGSVILRTPGWVG